MAKEKAPYPLLKKTDNLGRLVYVDWNGVERSIYKYWGNTNKIKLKYQLFHQEVSLDAYSTGGKNMMSYSSGIFDINLPGVWTHKNGDIAFKVKRPMLSAWVKISKAKLWRSDRWLKKINPLFEIDGI